MVLPRDVLVFSPSGWQFWQINVMSFDWRKSVLLIPNKEIEQVMLHKLKENVYWIKHRRYWCNPSNTQKKK